MMLSKTDSLRQKIRDATSLTKLFPYMDNQENKSNVTHQCDIKLPSSYPFKSSQQIEKNVSITHHITHQSSKQHPTTLHNQWPKSCIGLILCEHHQNNQTFYVYGTGALIHRNIVLTSAQNVYCRRLKIQYTNIKFIVGVSGDKCSGIYDVKRIHYPKAYTMQDYDNYNFAVLQLYDDLTKSCGYVGLKIIENIEVDDKLITYEYTTGNKEGSLELRERTKNEKQQLDRDYCSGSGVLIKKNNYNKYYIVGLQNLRKYFLSEKIRNVINQWTHLNTIDLNHKNIGAEGCKYLSQFNWTFLNFIALSYNNIGTQGCKQLSQSNWANLSTIYLGYNNIDAQGCKYLSQVNWTYLTTIYLWGNNISTQGCKYLTQANWAHLTSIYLSKNNIDATGCKYLSQANWTHLSTISLDNNEIGAQGCKYLSQANWKHLNAINLKNNNIEYIVYRLLLLQLYPNKVIKI